MPSAARAIRVAPVGLRAGLLATRWPRLVAELDDPLIVSAGVCGGLDPALAQGDLVLPESIIGPTDELLNVTPSHHRAAEALALSVSTGRLITTREVIRTPEAKATLFARTGAVAADMESSLIVSMAAAAGLPSLVVRAVSDAATESSPSGADQTRDARRTPQGHECRRPPRPAHDLAARARAARARRDRLLPTWPA